MEVLFSLSITLVIICSLSGLFNLIKHTYQIYKQSNEDIYIAVKQCSQYVIGTSYIEADDVFRYINMDGEETTLELDQNRLVKKPGFEILLFNVDDVSFSKKNDFIYIHITRNNQTYTFLLTYAFFNQEEDEKYDTAS